MARTKTFQGFPWGMMALCTVVFYATTIVMKYKMLDVSLGDTDDAMRLVQLREYLKHGNWFDLHTNRVGGAEGYTTHWSRIPDAIMAGIFFMIQPFTSLEFAERVTRMVYPGLWIAIPAVASSLFTYWFTGNRLVVVIMVFLFALNPFTFVQFGAGRIDHHNAQIALSVLTLVAAALQKVDFRFAILSGISIGVMFTIGLEALPFAVVAAAAVAVNYAFYEDGKKAAQGFAAAMVLTTLLGFGVSFPPSQYLQTACDALGFNLVAAIVLGGGVLFVWSGAQRLSNSLVSRSIGLGIAALCAAVTYANIDPACLGGPFGHVNPAVKPMWLDRVIEMQPPLRWGAVEQNFKSLRFLYILVLAIPAMIILLLKRQNRKDFAFLVLLSGFAVSVILGFMNMRISTYISWFATPLVCLAIVNLIETLVRPKLIVSFVLIVLCSPVAMLFWEKPFSSTVQAESSLESTPCNATQNYAALADLPKGLVLAEIDRGPYVLAHTEHSVVAAPYHRMSDKIIEVMNFFSMEVSDQSRQTANRLGAQYVLFCSLENTKADSLKSSSLISSLQSGNAPTWLEKIELPKGNPLVLFRLLKSE